MNNLLDPITQRDFSAGRISKTAVATALMPNYSSHSLTSAVNSVATSINYDFSEIIGSAIVRKGKQNRATLIAAGTDSQSQTNSNGYSPVYGTNWYTQTFTAQTGQTPLLAFTPLIYKHGNAPIDTATPTANPTVSLRATSGGLPTGPDLETVTMDLSGITTNTNGQYYSFNFIPKIALIAGTVYALVFRFPDGDSNNYIGWRINTAGGYAGGQAAASTDSGVTWTATTGQDYAFHVYTVNAAGTVNLNPLGNYGFLESNVPLSVVGYVNRIDLTGTIFYRNSTNGIWDTSTLSQLHINNAPIRFVNMDGSVFMANGVDPMKASADGGNTWGTTNAIWTDGVVPSLLIVSSNRILASGYAGFPSRVYFSSLVDPNSSPFITWNTDPSTGDWIDIDPDSGGVVTGFANTSSLTLVFKNNGMYRLNTIARTVDAENIFNVGAVSQEAIVNCLGLTYFWSGNGIYSTDGTFPQQVSRLGVQDFLDAITNTLSGFTYQVFAGTDGFNVYFSIGTVTLTYGPEDFRTNENVVLKFSPRDQNWQVFTYPQQMGQFTQFNVVPNVEFQSAQYDGHLEQLNYVDSSAGNSDNGAAIPYNLETQELEFGNRAHTKNISDQIIVFSRYGTEGSFLVKQNDGDFVSANMTMNNRINVSSNVNFQAEFFTFRSQGEVKGARPIFEGFFLPKVSDLGVIENGQ